MRRYCILFSLLIAGFRMYAQNQIKVKVLNAFGSPVANAEVYYCDDSDCQNGLTNQAGEVNFNMVYKPTGIIAYDTKGVMGMNAIRVQSSSREYSITLPLKPVNEQQAGAQMDQIWNSLVGLYSTYSDLQELADAYKVIQSGKVGGLSPSVYGVPGVFSISPLPVVGPDGKLGWALSGVLADKIVQLLMMTRVKMTGNQMFYQYTPAM